MRRVLVAAVPAAAALAGPRPCAGGTSPPRRPARPSPPPHESQRCCRQLPPLRGEDRRCRCRCCCLRGPPRPLPVPEPLDARPPRPAFAWRAAGAGWRCWPRGAAAEWGCGRTPCPRLRCSQGRSPPSGPAHPFTGFSTCRYRAEICVGYSAGLRPRRFEVWGSALQLSTTFPLTLTALQKGYPYAMLRASASTCSAGSMPRNSRL